MECYRVRLESSCALAVHAVSEEEACEKAADVIRKRPSALVWRAIAIELCDTGGEGLPPGTPFADVMDQCQLLPWVVEEPDIAVNDGDYGVAVELTLSVMAPSLFKATACAYQLLDCAAQWELGYSY